MEEGCIMNENCIKDEKMVIKICTMDEIIKKGYKVNGKLGRKIAQWMKIWKVEIVQKIKQWKIGMIHSPW